MLDRRDFLKTAGIAAAGSYASRLSAAQAGPSQAHRFTTFNYGDVQLLDGPLKKQFDENHAFFLKLDEDRLLKVFRQKAGLPAPGEDMGGWYDLTGFDLAKGDFHGFVPGHTLGQYVSALARCYAATGSEETKAKVHRLVKGYGATLDDKASFFAGYRLPAYTYDKLSCGLIDAHEFAHDPDAMAIHEKLTRGMLQYLPEKALSRAEQRARPHKDESFTWDESYTLPENLFLAYRRTGNKFYRELGTRFLEDDTYFNPLSEGINVLAGEHAYSHMNAFCSAMQAYLTLDSERHRKAARNGFRMVAEQSFATGGWGPSEAFVEFNKGQLGDSLEKSHSSFETPCGAYAHFKLTRYLLQTDGDSTYGDSMERVMYNTVLGAKPIQPDGTSFYYSDYATVGKKVYHNDKWPCCSGTLPQVAADYHISIYLKATDGVCVNLFVPSTLIWKASDGSCKLTQETKYPFETSVAMRFATTQPVEQTLYIRIPAWVTSEPALRVNGQRTDVAAKPGAFAAIRRTWKDGDRIDLDLPMGFELQPVDGQHEKLVALVHGPLVLFAIGDSRPRFHRSDLLDAKPSANNDWSVRAAGGKQVVFRSFLKIQDESYSTYVEI
ncbi:Protein of unknown function DUF1680 [Candidatus Koribacter versatilis Ellin345]|uniref:Uncharacterized protein n=1 Tax=Koribacter versatilis (strain Ellin345) TaxID=204669 RepID=Q1IUX5_KORVE|nr:beta-L-arabinofuranosidase domain-containing protein [Candidatus Koribacter versatilis]ABF39325.1 Protein of unknown function DUF1680 [Candidatus Koribacter versatilis Ellin345]